MRGITIPQEWLDRARDPRLPGSVVVGVVVVDWPELQLTESQILENAVARASGSDAPHPDLSLIEIIIPRYQP